MKTSKKKNKKIKAEAFDDAFDQGDVVEHLDLQSVKVHYPTQRITIDFPKHILASLDIEAAKVGVTRTAIIKMWVADRLSELRTEDKTWALAAAKSEREGYLTVNQTEKFLKELD